MKCTFCGQEQNNARATMVVKHDGKISYYCSTKCERNHKLGRSPKKTDWVIRRKD